MENPALRSGVHCIGVRTASRSGSQMLSHALDVYPGSSKFLRDTISAFSEISVGAIVTCIVLVLWAGSWVFAVVERAVNRIWGAVSRTFLHGRALTVGMVGVVGLLLSVSVLITSALVGLREVANRFSPRQVERYTLLASVGSAFWQIVFFADGSFSEVTAFAATFSGNALVLASGMRGPVRSHRATARSRAASSSSPRSPNPAPSRCSAWACSVSA